LTGRVLNQDDAYTGQGVENTLQLEHLLATALPNGRFPMGISIARTSFVLNQDDAYTGQGVENAEAGPS
jgi:hypothetical protein